MHIPDNFLSTPVWASLDAIAAPAVIAVSQRAKTVTNNDRLPLLGIMGAFVFAAQMINFPVGMGTSGHLVGGTLLACLIGPWPAALVITAILAIQALVFQDGGVLALGANVINMALAGVLFGYLPARALCGTRWRSWGIFTGGFCSVMASGILAMSELLISGIPMRSALIVSSLGLFAVNAILEGAITVSVLQAIERLHPDAAQLRPVFVANTPRGRNVMALIGTASLLLAGAGVFIASTMPDGLQRLGKILGIQWGTSPVFRSPLGDYYVQAFGAGWFSRAAAGICGLILIYLVCTLGGHLLVRFRRSYS